ncbi:MAG: hypothetical protein K6G76_01830 [Lachnospiraceae bacterium]|nr:hypothetical protein [Lachnospiraceae bacterium]
MINILSSFHIDSFLKGNVQFFFSYGIVIVIIILIYFIDRPYKDIPLPEVKEKHPVTAILKGIAGVVIFLAVLIGGLLLVTSINSYFVNEEVFLLYEWMAPAYFIATIYLFIICVWMYSKYGLFCNRLFGENGVRCHLPKHIKKRVLIISVLVYVLGLASFSFCYDCITPKGVVKRVFVLTKEYTWEDVDYYYMYSGIDGILCYDVVMKDGARVKCLNDGVREYELPEDKYPNGDLDFCVELTATFNSMGIPLKDTDFDKLLEKVDADSDIDCVKKIREIVSQGCITNDEDIF